jgi:hypothetical protein
MGSSFAELCDGLGEVDGGLVAEGGEAGVFEVAAVEGVEGVEGG